MRTIFPRGAERVGDAALISAARSGDAAAYAKLTARHTDSARRLAGLLVPSDGIDALVAEAFSKIYLVLQRGDGPDLAFRPYLLTAVRRLHVDHLPQTPGAAPAPQPAATIDHAAAARAFTSLAEPWRMVLWHTEVEGQSADDVAALLGESPNAVPALIARAGEGMRIAWLTLHEPATDAECDWTRHHLGAYVRKVSFDRDTARVETHLTGCERCSAICRELTDGAADLRGILAPLVLGPSAAAYLATIDSAEELVAPAARQRPSVGAALAPVTSFFGRIGGVVAGAVASAAATTAGAAAEARAAATGRIGDQLDRVRDVVTTSPVRAAVTGVAAVAVIGAGAFIVVQTADGPPEASAEAPLADTLDDEASTAPEGDDVPDDGQDIAGGDMISRIGDAATASVSGDPSEAPSDDPTESTSALPTDDPTDGVPDPTQSPTGPGEPPSQQPTGPGEQPTPSPTLQPTRPPTQQPTQPPTQQPTRPPTQSPAPPTDLSISASSRDLAGLVWSIDVYITGLAPGRTATLEMRSSGGSGSTTDSRCSRVSGNGATCRITSTPATVRFSASTIGGRSNTISFTVTPDGDSDANTSDNSTSVTIRP